MVESLIKILETGLSIWDHHEKTKYLDQLIGLKREYYAEFDKGEERRSSAILDDVLGRLRILGDSFVATAGKKDA